MTFGRRLHPNRGATGDRRRRCREGLLPQQQQHHRRPESHRRREGEVQLMCSSKSLSPAAADQHQQVWLKIFLPLGVAGARLASRGGGLALEEFQMDRHTGVVDGAWAWG